MKIWMYRRCPVQPVNQCWHFKVSSRTKGLWSSEHGRVLSLHMCGYTPERIQSGCVLIYEWLSKPDSTNEWDVSLLLYAKLWLFMYLFLLIKGFHIFFCKYAGRRKEEPLLYLCAVWNLFFKSSVFPGRMICNIIAHRCSLLVNDKFT